MSIDVLNFLQTAADNTGFIRERLSEKNIPTDPKNIAVLPFFGDMRSFFILSSLLLNRYREEDKSGKYFILCSWSGYEELFPYVDEYWGLNADVEQTKRFYRTASQFANKSEITYLCYRNLNYYFFKNITFVENEFKKYYDNGLTDEFWQKYKYVKKFLAPVPSSSVLKDFNRELAQRAGYKIFLYPSIYISQWKMGKVSMTFVRKDFWIHLINRLISEGYLPVICKSPLTYDLSADFVNKCLYVNESNIGKVLAVMRATSCVLDLFTGFSRFALVARCPFMVVEERAKYIALKDYEIDDLCGKGVPRQYIFSFPTIIEGGNPTSWDGSIINIVINRLSNFLPELDRDNLPPTDKVDEIVSYDSVRKKKLKRIGSRLLKVPRG